MNEEPKCTCIPLDSSEGPIHEWDCDILNEQGEDDGSDQADD